MEKKGPSDVPDHGGDGQEPPAGDRLIVLGTVTMSFVCFLALLTRGTEPHEALMLTLALAAAMRRIGPGRPGGPGDHAGLSAGWR
jgi:hypothetical protein